VALAALWAAPMKTYGTKMATSASGLLSVIELAIPAASVSASSTVVGLSFQFPEMKGFRAMSIATDEEEDGRDRAEGATETNDGEKADALSAAASVSDGYFISLSLFLSLTGTAEKLFQFIR
jgi:hypothetical protein